MSGSHLGLTVPHLRTDYLLYVLIPAKGSDKRVVQIGGTARVLFNPPRRST
jgi:hypothetical protein